MSVPDAFSVSTPEQVELEFSIANLGSRFTAILLDSILGGVMGIVVLIAGLALARELRGLVLGTWVTAGLLLAMFLLYWGYFSIFEITWRGQTPGKRAARLRVMSVDGRPATVGQVLIRNLLRLVDALPGVYAVGAVCMLLNRRAQRLGDLAAGTLVVHAGEMALPPSLPAAPPAAIAAAQGLTPEDLQLIETFLHRRGSMSAGLRAATAEKIGARLAAHLPPEAREWTQSEAGLEGLAAAGRAAAGGAGRRYDYGARHGP